MLATLNLAWTISRAAGIAALLCASVSVGLGLAMATRLLKGRSKDFKVVHEALSLATLTALAVHALALLADPWLKTSVLQVLVPFSMNYRPLWTGVGTIAGWLLATLSPTYYVRGRIGPRRWRKLHRFAALGWVLAVGHSLGSGTDAGAPWFLASLAIVGLPALALLLHRWLPEEWPRTLGADARTQAR